MRRRVMDSSADANTLMLLHFDNNIVDETGNYSFAANGSFGYAGGKFSNCLNAASGGIRGNLNNLQLDDFTIDWWDKLSSNTTGAALDIYGYALLNHLGNHYILLGTDVNWTIITSVGVNDGVWHHRAIVRKGNVFYVFQDGVFLSTFTNNKRLPPLGVIGIGKRSTQAVPDVFRGLIDEVRISNIARWTSNFTPPTKPY